MEEKYKKFLSPNEKLIKVIDYATSQFIWDLIWSIILIPILIGIWGLFDSIYKKLTLKYLITDKRVIFKKGLIGQSTVSADYSKITDVTVNQGIVGRILLHTGTIVLNTAGGDVEEIQLKWVSNPFEAKNFIYEQMHKK